MALGQCFGTRPKRNSFKFDVSVPLCKECINPRCPEEYRLVATLAQNEEVRPVCALAISYLCGAQGLDIYVLGVPRRHSICVPNHRRRL